MLVDTLIGQTVHGNLVIRSLLGEGSMGRVYLAENAAVHERRYAVKVLKQSLTNQAGFTARFYEEARHQAQMDHPNIVEMVDYFQIGDDYFLVQDYVEGHTVDDILDRRKTGIPEKQSLSIIKDVLNGLDCAHRKAIVHRDVKPSNVMVDMSGRARLTDFGIASQLGSAKQLAEAGVSGTPAYMSPEQLAGSADLDHRSDVYAAGILLYEMLTGKLPFEGKTFDAVRLEQGGPVPNPRTVNENIKKGLANIVRVALQPNVEQRYQGCKDMLRAIEKYQRGANWKLAAAGCATVLLATCLVFFVNRAKDKAAIGSAVTSAVDNYSFLCRDAPTLILKRRGKQYADATGNSGIADQLAAQISELETNLSKFSQGYASQIAQLTNFRESQVADVLQTPEDDPVRARFRKLLQADYQLYRNQKVKPAQEQMLAQCNAAR